MKFMVVSSTGNSGKSFISREVIYANLPEGERKIIEVESINSASEDIAGIERTRISGENIRELFFQVSSTPNVVVDVGSTDFINLLRGLKMASPVLSSMDKIIVPVIGESRKYVKDAETTLRALRELGVPKDKVVVVLNKSDRARADVIEDMRKAVTEAGYDFDPEHSSLPFYDVVEDLLEKGALSTEFDPFEGDIDALVQKYLSRGEDEKARKMAEYKFSAILVDDMKRRAKEVFREVLGKESAEAGESARRESPVVEKAKEPSGERERAATPADMLDDTESGSTEEGKESAGGSGPGLGIPNGVGTGGDPEHTSLEKGKSEEGNSPFF